MFHKGEMVRIEWIDACCHFDDVPNEWIEQRGKTGGIPSITVGALVYSNRRCVMVAMTEADFEPDDIRLHNILCIPRGMITRFVALKEDHVLSRR